MIQIDLTTEERRILADVLDSYLSDLRMEIASTDRKEFREDLKVQKTVVEKVLQVLRSG